ncbi:MAG: leucyl aminopeptidase, partial [bacterium]
APKKEPLGCLVCFALEDRVKPPAAAPAEWRDLIAKTAKLKDFTGKAGQTLTLMPRAGTAQRILLVGLGERAELDREKLRRAAGHAGKALAGMNIQQAGVWMPAGLPRGLASGETVAEGLVLGAYTFKAYKAPPKKNAPAELRQTILFDPDRNTTRDSVARGLVRGEAVCTARSLGNHPGNVMTPTRLADEARSIAKRRGLRCTVMDRARMESLGMGLLLGVTRGSREPPKLIVMEYRPRGAKGTLAFVGKGITFDSGGISLKPGAAMDEMKFDMCGAAAVLGAMDAIGQLKPKVNVIGIVPACENLPDGEATKPGDILKSFTGKHVEVLNTDAEGRLVLADALAYGIKQYKPDAVVDLATLTGACVVALGHYATGAISNDEAFEKKVVAAGKASGDIVWPLPNFPEYAEGLKGKYADLQNIAGRDGGTITGGLFLKNFVGDVPWVHLDIAGTAWGVKGVGHIPYEGASGVGVCLLTDLAESWN